MADIKRKKLVLEDGAEYIGVGFGYDCERVCEVVFNTSVVGYQEEADFAKIVADHLK